LIKNYVPCKVGKWKESNYEDIEKLNPNTISRVAVKNPWIIKAYQDKLSFICARNQEFPPIFGNDSKFDFKNTFSYEKVALIAQLNLKKDVAKKITCSCGKLFVKYAKYKNHQKIWAVQAGCEDFK
jgi:hypothetical protein